MIDSGIPASDHSEEQKALADVKSLGKRLSNWGRWGTDDELGTLNYITPQARIEAAKLVRTGKTIALGMPFDENGPQAGGIRFNPIHEMTMLLTDPPFPGGMIAADDKITMPLQCATQWDSLAHVGYDGMIYNGVPAQSVSAEAGATRNSFDKAASKLVGRGVLLDIPRLKGVERLPRDHEVTAEDLTAAAEGQKVEITSGDIVLVRTGWYRYFLEGDVDAYMSPECPGLGLSSCAWLQKHEIAAVATDTYALEIRPSRQLPASLPLHMILIRDVGLTLGEIFNLEDLAADCVADGRYEFLFTGLGLQITGSVGSPVSPVAIK